MPTVTSVALALILALSVVPAMAGDTFQAFSKMSTDKQDLLTPLADNQLAAIEGGFFDEVCIVCLNIAVIEQLNVDVYGAFNSQVNQAAVSQEIN
jgi:hypothetical protein